MTTRHRVDNTALRVLVKEANWTNQSLAAAVNRVAGETGFVLHYDRTTVSHWLSGSRPRPPVPGLIAEAFSRRIGRRVSAAEIGMAGAESVEPPEPGTEHVPAIIALHDLVTADLDPACRATLCEQPFRVDWTVCRPSRWAPGGAPDGEDPPPRAGSGSGAAVRTMTTAFAAVDRAFGGGTTRSAMLMYLATDVMILARPRPGAQPDRELLGATAALARLMGFKCFDSLHHNLAQRYYRIALRLAEEADDPVEYARVLHDMSVQAWFLGHYPHAARLADAAVDHAGPTGHSGISAVLLGQSAVAHASLSHRREALSLLAEAEYLLTRTADPDRAGEPALRAVLAHRAGQALALLHDHLRAESRLRESLRNYPRRERRSRMLTTHVLADLQLAQGRVAQASATWDHFLRDYSYMHSRRVTSVFRSFRVKLESHCDGRTAGRAARRTR